MRSERIKELSKSLYDCKSEQEICNLVTDTIAKYGGDVVRDDAGAVAHFEGCDMFGEVKHNTIINQTIDLCNVIDGKEVWFGVKVEVTEHYIDSGSEDYVYSYEISVV